MVTAEQLWPATSAEPPSPDPELYHELAAEDGRELVVRGADVLADRWLIAAKPQRERLAGRCTDVIRAVAGFVPEALSGLHTRLLDAGIIDELAIDASDFFVFYGADGETRDRLIRALDGDLGHRHAPLHALAWIGDGVVRAMFAGWQRQPPAWADGLWQPAHTFAREAGWCLTRRGELRSLITRSSHLLEPGPSTGPLTVFAANEGRCDWCRTPLTTLFDLDLEDPRLRFLGMAGRRLRIATCMGCTCYETVYTDVDVDGAATWSAHNVRPDYLPERGVEQAESTLAMRLGRARRTPFEAGATWDCERSQIGGLPTWVQNPDYPTCPRCGELMPFLGQLDLGRHVDPWEGLVYAFLDLPCGVAATVFQQT